VEDPVPEDEEQRGELRERLAARFARYCDEQRRLHGKPLVGEKTTETIHHLDLVEELFPGIRKVCIVRDPRDRVVSFHHHQIRKGRKPDGPIGAAEVAEYLERIRADYAGLLAIEAPCYVLTYEQLSTSSVAVLRELLRFIGADATEEHARTALEQARFERLAGRERGSEDGKSHYRKGVVGDWREQLDPQLAERMVTELDEQTRRLERRFGLDLAGYRAAGERPPSAVT